MLNDATIDLMFPKAVLVADNVNSAELNKYKNCVLKAFEKYGSKRIDTLSVDSSHKTYDKLNTEVDFESLVKSIHYYAGLYLKEYGYDDTFIQECKIINMWANSSNPGDSLEAHIHQSSLLSGAYYIESPAGSQLRFHDFSNMLPLPNNITSMSCNYRWYDAVPGRLLIFRSDMPHSTNKQPEGERIVISFNIRGPL